MECRQIIQGSWIGVTEIELERSGDVANEGYRHSVVRLICPMPLSTRSKPGDCSAKLRIFVVCVRGWLISIGEELVRNNGFAVIKQVWRCASCEK